MNERQQESLNHHCRLAVETMHPRFLRLRNGYSAILTVNSGYE